MRSGDVSDTARSIESAELATHLREVAGDEAPSETFFIERDPKPITTFDRKFCGALLRTQGNTREAYRMVTGQDLPMPDELVTLRDHSKRITVDQAIARGYNHPSKDDIVAMLMEKALHSPIESVQLAATAQLAKLMPGWIAPSESNTKHLRVNVGEDFLKRVQALDHVPGAPEKVADRD